MKWKYPAGIWIQELKKIPVRHRNWFGWVFKNTCGHVNRPFRLGRWLIAEVWIRLIKDPSVFWCFQPRGLLSASLLWSGLCFVLSCQIASTCFPFVHIFLGPQSTYNNFSRKSSLPKSKHHHQAANHCSALRLDRGQAFQQSRFHGHDGILSSVLSVSASFSAVVVTR